MNKIKNICYFGTKCNFSFPYKSLQKLDKDLLSNDNFYIIDDDIIDEKELNRLKLWKYHNFIFSSFFNKKIALVYGNCHTIPIIQSLKLQKDFTDNYNIYEILPICVIKDSDYFSLPVFHYFCDLFIHQDIRKENPYGEEFSSANIIGNLPQNCKVLSIPNLYRMPTFLFPQNDHDVRFDFRGQKVFSYDSILDSWIRKHWKAMPQKQYINELKNINENYDQQKTIFFNKLAHREANWTIKISDFILNNLNKNLFYDPNHPTELLINEIIKRICNSLECEYHEKSVVILDAIEMPSVLNANRDIILRKNSTIFYKNGLTLKDYIKFYCYIQHQNKNLCKIKRFYFLIKFKVKVFICRGNRFIYNIFVGNKKP